jgi:hypothetical protein
MQTGMATLFTNDLWKKRRSAEQKAPEWANKLRERKVRGPTMWDFPRVSMMISATIAIARKQTGRDSRSLLSGPDASPAEVGSRSTALS